MELRIPIVPGRIRPPHLPGVFVERLGDGAHLSNLLESQVCLVVAPAGYGKTSFISWVARQSPLTVAWVSAFNDMDAAYFLNYLVAALAQALPGWGVKTREILSAGTGSTNFTLLCAQLSEELWLESRLEDSPGLLLIIDDCQHLADNSEVMGIMEDLLSQLPDKVHLCLASRRELPLALTRLGLTRKIHRIDSEALRFSARDNLIPLLPQTEAPGWGQEVEQILRLTGGWITGIILSIQSGLHHREYAAALSDPLPDKKNAPQLLASEQDNSRLFAYFLDEVLKNERTEMQLFLMRISRLYRVTKSCCEALWGPEALKLLDEAYHRCLFISRLSAQEPTYVLHDLFRSSLEKYADESGLTSGLEEVERRAASYYEENGEFESAMHHWLRLGETAEAAAVLIRLGEALIRAGMIDELYYWLKRLPVEIRENDPELLYLWGFVHQQSDPPTALQALDKATYGFAARKDLHRQVQALIIMATLYSLQNKVDKVKETAGKIPVLSALLTDSWARGVLTVSALTQTTWDDQLQRGLWLYRLARLLKLEPDWEWAMLAYACMLFYRLGDLTEAEQVITKALALPVVQNNPMWKGLGLTLWHVVLYSQNDVSRGAQVAEELWELGEQYDSDYYRAYAERSRAMDRYHQGNWDAALAHFASSLYFFQQIDNRPMSCITRLDTAVARVCKLAAGGSTEFHPPGSSLQREMYEEGKKALGELRQLHPGQGLEDLAESLLGILARECGELDEAERYLLHSAAQSRRKNSKQMLAGTCLHLADLYRLRQNVQKAERYLREAYSLMARNSYHVIWDWYKPTWRRMGQWALKLGVEKEYVGGLMQEWFGSDGVELDFPALKSPAGGINTLEVLSLGRFEVILNGERIPQRAWQSRKVQNIFKYLLLQRGRAVTRDELLDLFWPEAEPESASASLRVTLTRLRKALNLVHCGQGTSNEDFWQESRGSVRLNHTLIAWDVLRFEEALQRGLQSACSDIHSDEAAMLLERALQQYQGELLPENKYNDWATLERERLQSLYLDGCLALARLYLRRYTAELHPHPANRLHPDCLKAQQLLQNIQSIDPYREDFYLELAELHLLHEDKGEAMRILAKCREMLRDEYGVDPGSRYRELLQRARGQG